MINREAHGSHEFHGYTKVNGPLEAQMLLDQLIMLGRSQLDSLSLRRVAEVF